MMKRAGVVWRGLRQRLAAIGVIAVAGVLAAPAAQAVLGGDAASVHEDQVRMKGVRRQTLALSAQTPVQVHDIALADGSGIREYVAPNGIVFAVSWRTRFKPNLASLLGQYAASYSAAASEAMKAPGIKRNVVLQRDDLVVHATAHLNSFAGMAYARSLVPVGVNVNELR